MSVRHVPDRTRLALSVRGIHHEYESSSGTVRALRGVDLEVRTGEFVAIMGPSGSGKTTLLNCSAGLQRASEGEIRLGEHRIAELDESRLARLRRRELGFVFQSFNLLPVLSVIDNVELPVRLDGRPVDHRRTLDLLGRVGLAERADRRPDQLSGGQRQRVAIARALVTDPRIVFADEPTGALDLRSAKDVLALLRGLADRGQTIIMVTHDPVAASFSDRVLFLADGRIVSHLERPDSLTVAATMAELVESAEVAAAGVGAGSR